MQIIDAGERPCNAGPHNRATGFFAQTFHAKQTETKSRGDGGFVQCPMSNVQCLFFTLDFGL